MVKSDRSPDQQEVFVMVVARRLPNFIPDVLYKFVKPNCGNILS